MEWWNWWCICVASTSTPYPSLTATFKLWLCGVLPVYSRTGVITQWYTQVTSTLCLYPANTQTLWRLAEPTKSSLTEMVEESAQTQVKPKKSKSRSERRAAKASRSSGRTEKLKTVVRRLPPNLPEEVFWQSVQPWVTSETASWKAFYPGKLRKSWVTNDCGINMDLSSVFWTLG